MVFLPVFGKAVRFAGKAIVAAIGHRGQIAADVTLDLGVGRVVDAARHKEGSTVLFGQGDDMELLPAVTTEPGRVEPVAVA